MRDEEENTQLRLVHEGVPVKAPSSRSEPGLPVIRITSEPLDLPSPQTLTDHIEFSSLAHTVEEYTLSGKQALTKLIEPLSAYLRTRVASDELEIFCLSLQHLFSNVDTLYCQALPGLNDSAYAARSVSGSGFDLYSRQHIWSQLQVIKRVLRTVEPLCKLLATITATLLGDLEYSQQGGNAWEGQIEDTPWTLLPDEDWEQTSVALCESAGCWQQCLMNQPSFFTQFTGSPVSPQTLAQLDSVFKGLLECAVALFGDILPGFNLVIWKGDTELAAHLLDLAQQVDQMLFLAQKLRDPLLLLLDSFGAVN